MGGFNPLTASSPWQNDWDLTGPYNSASITGLSLELDPGSPKCLNLISGPGPSVLLSIPRFDTPLNYSKGRLTEASNHGQVGGWVQVFIGIAVMYRTGCL